MAFTEGQLQGEGGDASEDQGEKGGRQKGALAARREASRREKTRWPKKKLDRWGCGVEEEEKAYRKKGRKIKLRRPKDREKKHKTRKNN